MSGSLADADLIMSSQGMENANEDISALTAHCKADFEADIKDLVHCGEYEELSALFDGQGNSLQSLVDNEFYAMEEAIKKILNTNVENKDLIEATDKKIASRHDEFVNRVKAK